MLLLDSLLPLLPCPLRLLAPCRRTGPLTVCARSAAAEGAGGGGVAMAGVAMAGVGGGGGELFGDAGWSRRCKIPVSGYRPAGWPWCGRRTSTTNIMDARAAD